MRIPALAILAVAAAQTAELSTPAVPNSPDFTIKTRVTACAGCTVDTRTVYAKGGRRRDESLAELPASVAGRRIYTNVEILQCDERRSVFLNADAKVYSIHAFADPSARLAVLRERASSQPVEQPAGPDVTITIDSVDTGERRQLGRYVARHVVTTRRVDAAPGAHHRSDSMRQDGWYIDLPDCSASRTGQTFLTIGEVVGRGEPRDRVRFDIRGTAPRGYAIEETTRSGDRDWMEKIELLEFSEAPVDPRLFEIPADYQPALPLPWGGYDMSKPDTIPNRIAAYYGAAKNWLNAVIARASR